MSRTSFPGPWTPLFFLLAFFFSSPLFYCGCGKTPGAVQREAPQVVVAYPEKRDVQFYFTTMGTAEAFEDTTVAARVFGELKEIRYTPGSIVFKGDPLFLIEPDKYQANVDAAQAALGSAIAERDYALATLNRSKVLIESTTISQEEYDQNLAQYKIAEAKIHECEAELKIRELDLQYTDVRAPINGKTDRNLIDIGNLVGSTPENSNLTTIANLDPILIYFDVSSMQSNLFREIRAEVDEDMQATMEKLKKARKDSPGVVLPDTPDPNDVEHENIGSTENPMENTLAIGVPIGRVMERAESVEHRHFPFSIALHEGPGGIRNYQFNGIIDLSGNRINEKTAVMQFRGQVPNENYIIYPGQSVYVRIPTYVEKDAVVIRDESIGTDLNKKYVYIVNEQGIVERKDVKLGPLQDDGTRVVYEGLTHQDRYILRGIQKVRTGKPATILPEDQAPQPPSPKTSQNTETAMRT